jgi:hypothetical protein
MDPVAERLRKAVTLYRQGVALDRIATRCRLDVDDIKLARIIPGNIDQIAMDIVRREHEAPQSAHRAASKPKAKAKAKAKAKRSPLSEAIKPVKVERARAMALLGAAPEAIDKKTETTLRARATRPPQRPPTVRDLIDAAVAAGKVTHCPPQRARNPLRWETGCH